MNWLHRVAIGFLVAATLATLSIGYFASSFLYQYSKVARDLDTKVSAVDVTKLNDTITQAQATVKTYQNLAVQIQPALNQLNAATASEISAVAKTQLELYKVVADSRLAIVDTNCSLNGNCPLVPVGVLGQLSTSLVGLNNLEDSLKPPIQTLSDSLVQLPPIIKTFSVSANNLASATEDVKTTVHYESQQLMKPVKKIKVALEFSASILGKLFGL